MAERNTNNRSEGSEIESLLRIPRDFGNGSSDLILGTMERAEAMEEGTAADDVAGEDEEDDMQDSLRILMGRLRCLFGVLTCPIPPLFVVVAVTSVHFIIVAVVPFMYKAIREMVTSHQLHHPSVTLDCGDRPIFLYVLLTMVVFAYAPVHLHHRRHDKVVNSLALLYLYFGMVVLQGCSQTPDNNADNENHETVVPPPTCETECPALVRALHIYVGAMELFTLSLFIPLLVLPCIYVWFLRQADQGRTMAEFHQRYGREGNSASSTTVAHILEQGLRTVHLVEQGERVVIVGRNNNSSGTTTTHARECCICMTDLLDNHKAVVQTKACGHLFHRQCLASWIAGRWEGGGRRARRTTCPLCRSELLPSSSTASSTYGTMR